MKLSPKLMKRKSIDENPNGMWKSSSRCCMSILMVMETRIICYMFQTRKIVIGVVAPSKNEIDEIPIWLKKNAYQRDTRSVYSRVKHSVEQLSSLSLLPSSHSSSPLTIPSPQTVEHDVGSKPSHAHPSSIRQIKQPSPVSPFSSSHSSKLETIKPSPHMGSQVVFVALQSQPVSTSQFESQPSRLLVFPSSHSSPLSA